MLRITVETGWSYEVLVGRGLLAQAGALTAGVHAPCRVAIVSDENVAALYMEKVSQSYAGAGFSVVEYRFVAGERSKNMEELTRLLEFLAENGLGRGDMIAALGGGVTGDLAGFAAACYQRGISYVQLPTSLLAAVDSSVGGKTAVDLAAGKNLAGAFWQPELVICDCDAFFTLPPEELASGAAECVKYAMLCDPKLLDTLTEQGPAAAWEEIVAPCVRYKAQIVREDERENGVRKLLNLGHTVGHAIEKLSDYCVRHGEGVAVGMTILTRAAEKQGLCESGTTVRLTAALEALALPTACGYSADELARVAAGDKKRQGDDITLILPRAVGDCLLKTVPVAELRDWIALGMEE